jgi:NADP-dependent 3-hydroxy acid dehydrogenase YdfG
MARILAGRVALVTGVTAGIGRCLARDLLAAGAAVVGCARDSDRLGVVADELPGLVPIPCNVRNRTERADLVRAALERCGQVDLLVHNAGVGYVGSVVDMSAEDVERIVETNTTAMIDLTRLVLPDMVRRRDGDVLVVSSVAVWLPLPPLTAYAASKRGVDGFVEGVRREVAPHGVRIHSVNPAFVATEFHARALGLRPREGDPGVHPMIGIDPARVARQVVRELQAGRGRTVAMPRVLGLARLLGLPPLAQLVDFGTRAVSASLARIGPALAEARAPAAQCADRDICSERGLGAAP